MHRRFARIGLAALVVFTVPASSFAALLPDPPKGPAATQPSSSTADRAIMGAFPQIAPTQGAGPEMITTSTRDTFIAHKTGNFVMMAPNRWVNMTLTGIGPDFFSPTQRT
jgi:hypothetical protein